MKIQAVKITLSDNTSYATSVADGLTEQDIRGYFYIGRPHITENQFTGRETYLAIVEVEILEEK